MSGRVLAWLSSVWGEVQICIWPSWCHYHSLSLAPVNPDWFYQNGSAFLVLAYPGCPGKRPLNECSSSSSSSSRYQNQSRFYWSKRQWVLVASADTLPAAQPTASMHWRQKNGNILHLLDNSLALRACSFYCHRLFRFRYAETSVYFLQNIRIFTPSFQLTHSILLQIHILKALTVFSSANDIVQIFIRLAAEKNFNNPVSW